ncbi:hypothetical protein [Fusibacter sp. 3D3]|uniref:hypothetical protein n=1 Tax=Fusibacter sp. 3D3 TaxID=1048380 RepID=UPI00158636FE|nr:hypothetical protein [Fusibacter sp. 3D3]
MKIMKIILDATVLVVQNISGKGKIKYENNNVIILGKDKTIKNINFTIDLNFTLT